MNASRLPANSTLGKTSSSTQSRTGRSLIFSITGVCFIFGGLLAMQLRAIESVHAKEKQDKARVVQEQQLLAVMQNKAAQSEKERLEAQKKLATLKADLEKKGSLSKAQTQALAAQIKELQMIAGLTTVKGPGIKITLSDNPAMAQSGGDPSVPLPGLVHDYDLLQVVNEIRAAKADAIAIRGAGQEAIRVTGFTPIRCVGPTILVNWEPVAAPFTIEAIGDPKTLRSALEMPAGIVDNLKNQGAIGVKIVEEKDLKLAAATGGAPKMRVASAN
jgi:uncharacterized protein YlxW (UPF0749 family)